MLAELALFAAGGLHPGQAFEHLRWDGGAPFAGQLGQGALQRQQQVELDGARQQLIPVDADGVLLQHQEKIIPPQQVAAFMVQPQVSAQVQGQGGGVEDPRVGGSLRQRFAVVEEPVHATFWQGVAGREEGDVQLEQRFGTVIFLKDQLIDKLGRLRFGGAVLVTGFGQQAASGGEVLGPDEQVGIHHGAQGGFLVVSVEQTSAFKQNRLDTVGMQASEDVLQFVEPLGIAPGGGQVGPLAGGGSFGWK
jgi:hypothetical protein